MNKIISWLKILLRLKKKKAKKIYTPSLSKEALKTMPPPAQYGKKPKYTLEEWAKYVDENWKK